MDWFICLYTRFKEGNKIIICSYAKFNLKLCKSFLQLCLQVFLTLSQSFVKSQTISIIRKDDNLKRSFRPSGASQLIRTKNFKESKKQFDLMRDEKGEKFD